jgi:hypothetical protein
MDDLRIYNWALTESDIQELYALYSTDAEFLRTWGGEGSGEGQFDEPFGVAVSADGAVTVTDTSNHRIQQFSATGAFLRAWGSEGSGEGQFDEPFGVAVSADGTVTVTDRGNHRIQQFSATGEFLRTWGGNGSDVGQFNGPAGVAVSAGGTVTVADTGNHRIQQFSATGAFLRAWGGYGNGEGQFSWPHGVGVSADGTITVADTNNDRIQQFSVTGAFLRAWGSEGNTWAQFNSPVGVAVRSDGMVTVTDRDNDRIQQFSAMGEFLAGWGEEGSGEWQFSQPQGIAVATNGAVTVADTGNHRIQVFCQTRFDDVPCGHWAFEAISTLLDTGVTAGCGDGHYCPLAAVTRAQMAVFLLRGRHGGGYAPLAATGALFGDVESQDFAAAWIEQLAADGITSGCGAGRYCPDAAITRAQMAVFLLRGRYGSDYTPPPASGARFSDVGAQDFAADWIEQLAADGISGGCGGGRYCPEATVSREQMAAFLQRAFNL